MKLEEIQKKVKEANKVGLDMMLEQVEKLHQENGKLYDRIDELDGFLSKYDESPWVDKLPDHLNNLRMDMALKSLFVNLEQIGVEALEKFIETQLNPVQA